MKERPILFNGEMVRAILEGRKTQTRRVISPVWKPFKRECEEGWETPWATVWVSGTWHTWDGDGVGGENAADHPVSMAKEEAALAAIRQGFYSCPFGQPGDLLWVREAWAHDAPTLEDCRKRLEDGLAGGLPYGPYYRANPVHENTGLRWRPSIHMPRWASRITLEVVGVRVERLQEITKEDAMSEGMKEVGNCIPPKYDRDARQFFNGIGIGFGTSVDAFSNLWNSLARPGAAWADNPWVWAVEFKPVEVKS